MVVLSVKFSIGIREVAVFSITITGMRITKVAAKFTFRQEGAVKRPLSLPLPLPSP